MKLSFVILIFAILKFRNIDRSTFRRSKFWPPPVFPFFHFFSARGPASTMWLQPFSPMLYRIYNEGTGKLRTTCADTVGDFTVCPKSTSLWKK